MRTHFSQMFWGLLLVILDIRINGFDLLPDGLGYVIVAFGCAGLVEYSPRFVTARTLCLVLAVMWLVGFAVYGDPALVYGLVTAALNCAMMWQLLGGIAEFAYLERPDLAQRAETRRAVYVVLMIIMSLIPLLAKGSPDVRPLIVILVVGMLVLMVMILHLIHRVKTELAKP